MQLTMNIPVMQECKKNQISIISYDKQKLDNEFALMSSL